MYRDTTLREAAEAIMLIAEEGEKRRNERYAKFIAEANEAANERDMIIENKEFIREMNLNYKEVATTKLLSTAIKAIYITALERADVLEEADYKLAEGMVDKFVQENGAYALLRKMGGKTYLLDTLKTIVEDAAEDAAENADDSDKELDEVPKKTKDDMFEKLEGEENVEDAVEIISNRIAAAEEEFIKKNAEDKKKIEDIVADINDRVQAVKDDPKKDDETVEKIEQECAIEKMRRINDVYDNRSHNLFDHMVHEVACTVAKDATLKDIYSESGKLNIESIVTSTKCIYGFLECVNTLQLAKIDKEYIEKMINEK